ncbi:UDP-galactose transporter 1 [Spathaspora sp. JA1]|nr:UDP-galactose transporter 1 [Spathaspora sp. JA1]
MSSTIVEQSSMTKIKNPIKKQGGSLLTLITCVLGLYGTFLSWSILQERINTKPYGESQEYFQSPLIINIIQAICASIVGLVYTLFTSGSSPFDVFIKSEASRVKIFKSLLIISITSSLSSPLGYKSLNHLDYVAYLLAKSSKLIPVMFIHFILYKTKFPKYKYIVATMITMGVIMFTLSHGTKKTSINDGNSIYGMMLLFGSMILDGLTNSTQDQLFKQHAKLTGAKMMCLLNLFVALISLSYAVVFKFDEIKQTIMFVHKYQEFLIDILMFSICGAIGQIFVFIILEKFDSIVLITATVTRKMLSMILSVVLFGHKLNSTQWIGVLLVFGGIGYESMIKFKSKKKVE